MPMPYAEIIDRHGRKRRARPGEVLKDGERYHFRMELQDEDHDGNGDAYGLPPSHRRGFCFDKNRDLRDAAAIAYEERNERLQNAWRTDQQQQDGPRVTTRTLDGEEARALADQAYEERKQRLSNAWRTR